MAETATGSTNARRRNCSTISLDGWNLTTNCTRSLGRWRAPDRHMPAKHIVYVLRSVSEPERPYIGVTQELAARLDAHNAGRCAHTARYRPWEVVVAVHLPEPTALRFERYLKSGSGRAFAERHFGA